LAQCGCRWCGSPAACCPEPGGALAAGFGEDGAAPLTAGFGEDGAAPLTAAALADGITATRIAALSSATHPALRRKRMRARSCLGCM
jgi:hypothetical protein